MPETEQEKLENQDTESQVENKETENKETEKEQEEKQNMNEDGSNAGPSSGFFESMKEKIFGKPEESDQYDTEKKDVNTDDKSSSDESAQENVTENVKTYDQKISDDFAVAARGAGWNDSQIVDFAGDYTNEELNSMIGFFQQDKPQEVKGKEKEVIDTLNISDEVWNELKESNPTLVEKILRPLITENKSLKENMNSLKDSLGVVQKDKVDKELQDMEGVADEVFDKVSETFSVFGKTKELPRFPNGGVVPQGAAFEARNEVWQIAKRLFQTGKEGYTFRQAMKDGMDFYKGRNLEESVKQNVVKKIKEKQEDLTPKKSRKNAVKTYESEEDRKRDIVLKAAEQAGVKTNL